MRILQIEDDGATAQSVELMLKAEGFAVYTTDLGEEGIELAKSFEYDLILLDINLPDMSGFDVLRSLRHAKVSTPVLVVTGSGDPQNEIRSFAAGADDFMGKPFHRDVLIARIRAVIRRSKGHASPLIVIGNVAVNIEQKVVEVAGVRLHLTGCEYHVLELLALRKGATLTKEAFLNHMYGGMDEPEIRIIDVFVCKVRRKLRLAGALAYLETVWGRGYVLLDTPTPKPAGRVQAPQNVSKLNASLVAALADGELTFRELSAALHLWNTNSIRGCLNRLMQEGQIANVGGPYRASYRLKRGRVAA